MKHQLLLAFFGCLITQSLVAQYKFDNTTFRTVYLEDLCSELKKHPNALLLDVRSPGEFSDTSSYSGLNIGHLKGAMNITVRELDKRLKELPTDKNRPIFVYCSHSQRSRRSSKMLADSGFTNVFNINGGMTELNLIKNSADLCLTTLYETSNPFTLLAPKQAYQFISSQKDVFILDVRSDSCYNGIVRDDKLNAQGRLVGSTNIPLAQLAVSLAKIPQNRPILLVDSYGDESVKAARLLASNGYPEINILFNGLDRWMAEDKTARPAMERVWLHPMNYGFVPTEEFGRKLSANVPMLILDIRTKDEFNNQVKTNTYLNRGHIQNAVHIPLTELVSRLTEIKEFKNKDVVVYGFASSPETFTAARLLSAYGFSKVNVLTGGLWDIRWKAANIKGLSSLMKWVVDVPADNL